MRTKLKAYRWWDSKIPPLLAVGFFLLSAASPPVPLGTGLVALALFILASVGIAGFAHLLNDMYDVQVDALSGAKNLAGKTGSRRIVVFCILMFFALVPWLLLPLGVIGWILLACEFLFFTAYAVPPLRLKTRGVWGALADACYAHVIPVLVLWKTFSALSGLDTPFWFGGLLFLWTLALGLRNILQHQLNDLMIDRQAQIRTFAVRYGYGATTALILGVILPVEFVSFLALLGVFSLYVPWIVPVFVLYLVWEIYKMRLIWVQSVGNPLHIVSNGKTSLGGLVFLSRFYELWLPLCMLAALVLASPDYIVLAGLYLVLFKNGLTESVMDLRMLLAVKRPTFSPNPCK